MKLWDLVTRMAPGGGAGAPATVVITSAASVITALSPFSITVTFSKSVTGFEVGDLTVGNGAAGNFAGSGAVYTADITPAAAGSVTVDISADVVNEGNTAATPFSILSTLGFTADLDLTDVSVLFQDAARTTAITAADQQIKGVTDKSPAGNHFSTAGNGALYKTNIINGLPAALFDDAQANYLTTVADTISAGSFTAIICAKGDETNKLYLGGKTGASTAMLWQQAAGVFQYNTDQIDHSAVTTLASLTANIMWILQYNSGTGKIRVRHNNAATWSEANLSSYVPYLNCFFARRTSASYFSGYGYRVMVHPSVLSDAVINKFRDYLNTLYGEVFF